MVLLMAFAEYLVVLSTLGFSCLTPLLASLF